MNTIKKYRNVILRIIDVFVIVVSYYVAEIIINEQFQLTKELNSAIMNTIALAIIIYSAMLHFCKTYKNITRYETGYDYLVYVFACLVSCVIITISKLIFRNNIVSIRTNMIAALIIVTAIIGYRVVLRLILTGYYPIHKKILLMV